MNKEISDYIAQCEQEGINPYFIGYEPLETIYDNKLHSSRIVIIKEYSEFGNLPALVHKNDNNPEWGLGLEYLDASAPINTASVVLSQKRQPFGWELDITNSSGFKDYIFGPYSNV